MEINTQSKRDRGGREKEIEREREREREISGKGGWREA
jgi:general stress protein YciG